MLMLLFTFDAAWPPTKSRKLPSSPATSVSFASGRQLQRACGSIDQVATAVPVLSV